MNIGWPAAVIVLVTIVGVVSVVSAVIAARAAVAQEEAKGKYGDQYRTLAADYEALARETREVQAAMQADLADLRRNVESIERMMREVA